VDNGYELQRTDLGLDGITLLRFGLDCGFEVGKPCFVLVVLSCSVVRLWGTGLWWAKHNLNNVNYGAVHLSATSFW